MESWEWLGEDKVVQVRFGCDGAKKWCYHSAVLTYSSFWSTFEQVYLYSNIAFWECRHFAWWKLLLIYLYRWNIDLNSIYIQYIQHRHLSKCQCQLSRSEQRTVLGNNVIGSCVESASRILAKFQVRCMERAVTTDSSGYGVTCWDLNVLIMNGDGAALDNDLYIFGTRGYILVLLESC